MSQKHNPFTRVVDGAVGISKVGSGPMDDTMLEDIIDYPFLWDRPSVSATLRRGFDLGSHGNGPGFP